MQPCVLQEERPWLSLEPYSISSRRTKDRVSSNCSRSSSRSRACPPTRTARRISNAVPSSGSQPSGPSAGERRSIVFRTDLGRGMTDDNGPALSALMRAPAAIEADVSVNIEVLRELEEEVGSPHFADTLRSIGAAAATDVVVVSDTVWGLRARPALSGGLRGLRPMTSRLEYRDVVASIPVPRRACRTVLSLA